MTREGGALSVQRGDLVAGRYRTGEPLGPAWRAHDETGGTEVVLIPIAAPARDGDSAGDDEGATSALDTADALNTDRWRDRRGVLPVTGTATGDAGAWLVTEPIAARTLTEAVSQWGALPAEQVLLIAAGAITALSATGPRIAATADHILLTDDGQVLLLPIETTENDLATLATSLHLAAEGHPDRPAEPPHQPTLAPLISTLRDQEADRDTTLDRTFAELSRLGAPLDAAHGADTLHEAKTASAEAAEAADSADSAEDDPEATHVSEGADTNDATQAMSPSELLDDDEDNDAEDGADPDATHVTEGADTNDATQAMSPSELLDDDEEADGEDADDEDDSAERDEVAQEASAPDSVSKSDASDEPEDAEATQQISAPDSDGSEDSTRQVPLVAAADADGDAEVTQQVPAPDSDSDSSEDPTRQVPLVAAADTADADATQIVPSPVTAPDADSTITRPVPIVETAAASDAIPESPTQEISSPDDSATRALPIPAAALSEPVPSPAPAPAQNNPFVAPTQAADIVPPQPQPFATPPTQAADAVPPGGAPNPWLQPPQPQPLGQPQPQPQPFGQPQPQPQPQGAWQQSGPGPQPQQGAWGPGPGPGPGPGQPPYPPNQPPYFPQQGPPPGKGNGGKTAAIIVGAVAAVAAVVSLVVLTTRSNGSGSSDTLGNAGHSTASSNAGPTGPSSVPGTNFPTGSSTSSSDDSVPTDTGSDTSSDGSDTATSTDSPPALTSTPFDPAQLNAFQTDKTPLELDALVPQQFTDDKGVHYTLKAGSVQPCVQTDMSSNMQDILTSNSCSKEIAAAYVDDSGQYLVSVKVLPLPDQHTATTVYNDLAQQSAADFGIWCPGSGPGSTTCQGDYQSATIKQYREQQHRYIILSVALAVNHSQSTSIAPWLDAAAKKAVDTAGPDNWSGNQ
ncbi:hypothetical protein ABIA31_003220 [Catenulispora sp. MAP5-51]